MSIRFPKWWLIIKSQQLVIAMTDIRVTKATAEQSKQMYLLRFTLGEFYMDNYVEIALLLF